MKREGFVPISEVCRRTLLSDPQVRYLIARRKLPAVKVGSRWLVSEASLRERLEVGR